MSAILCAAGIVGTTGFGGSSYRLTTCLLPGMQVTLLVMSLGVGSRAFSFVMAEVIGYLGLLSSPWITSLTIPGSSFTDCQFLQIIISLLFLDRILTSLDLVQWENIDRTKVSVGLIQMSALVALTNLCTAGIIDTVTEFGGSICKLTTCLPGMQVVLVFGAYSLGSSILTLAY